MQEKVLTVAPGGICHAASMCCAIVAAALVAVLQPGRVYAGGGERQREVERGADSSGKRERAKGEGPVVDA